MAPRKDSGLLTEINGDDTFENDDRFPKLIAPQAEPRKYEIVYPNLLVHGYLNLSALYGGYLALTSAKWPTLLFGIILYIVSIIGITAGTHRLWSHKSYKAKLPLQIILMVFTSIAYQDTVIHWARDHRLHHKYSDTDADPHNATRGFFYSHIGWIFVKKHPEAIERGKYIPIDDLLNNPVLQFQKKYTLPLIGACCFVLPTLIPVYFWEETLVNAWHTNMLRYVLSLHAIYCVNSLAHMVGFKPYDKNIAPTENPFTTLATCGEGFHNYHHTFPWDSRAPELGNYSLNLTTKFIDFFAWIGWAYDLKHASKDMIENRAKKTGDGTDSWGRIIVNKDTTKEETNNAE